MVIALIIILLVPLFLFWAAAHEYSHLLVAHLLCKVEKYNIRLYPHISDSGHFRWAGIYYFTKNNESMEDVALISIAPRIVNAIAIFFICCSPYFSFLELSAWFNFLWHLFWGSNIIDLIVGSIGYNKESDLMKLSRGSGINPWSIRMCGFTFAIIFLINVIYNCGLEKLL